MPDSAHRLLAPRPPLAVADRPSRVLPCNPVAVGQRLRSLGDGLRRIRRAFDHAAVELGRDVLDLDLRPAPAATPPAAACAIFSTSAGACVARKP